MKYVVWGCGKRGKPLAMLLGKDVVSAFIDRNEELKGTSFMGIPVIDYNSYLLQRKNELVIIAAKGHEKSIGNKLDKEGLPWVVVDTPAYMHILNQLRLGMGKILEQEEAKGINIIYGWNVYGLLIYEFLRNHSRKCSIILQDNISDELSRWTEQELPLIDKDDLKSRKVERFFWAEAAESQKWMSGVCNEQINAYEIYKEIDLFRNPELVQFRNIHKGKRCFIVATGPSLKIEDLNTLKLHGEICMSVNGIFKAFGMTEWRPDYYFLVDLFGLMQWKDDILQMEVKEKFIGDNAWYFEDSEEVTDNIHRFHLYLGIPEKGLPEFTEDFSKCAYSSSSVVYDGALQMAAYMGFDEIYMLGADCTLESTRKKQHFIDNYEDDKFSKAYNLDVGQLFKAYEAAKQYCEQHGIKLYNATRGGSLEVLERVDFDSLF